MAAGERFILESVREAVARYARFGAWDLEKDTLDDAGWECVFSADGGASPALRFVARRKPGDGATTFALLVELGGADALRKDEVRELCLERALAPRERAGKKKGAVTIEATARIWDGGLNRESFDGLIAALLELSDA